MLLLVGLGNPEREYAENRHNVGFMALDHIVQRHGFPPFRSKFQSLASEGQIGGEKVLALKPQTFMNVSGRAVAEAARFYKIPADDVIVIHDDLDLAPGKLKVKKGGGDGGHNGLKSIDSQFGNDYWRLRVGIGHPGNKEGVSHHVLSDFSATDQEWLDPLFAALSEHIGLLLHKDHARFLNEVALVLRAGGQEPADR